MRVITMSVPAFPEDKQKADNENVQATRPRGYREWTRLPAEGATLPEMTAWVAMQLGSAIEGWLVRCYFWLLSSILLFADT